MAKKRVAARPAKRPAKAKRATRTAKTTTETALVRVIDQQARDLAKQRQEPSLEALKHDIVGESLERRLSDETLLGELGLVEIKLTPEEEKVLSEPIDPNDILVKPTGQPYLPHTVYTKWLIRAFGRMGFSLVPAAKPMKVGNSIVCPYVLYIHRQPVAFAMGEQEYFESNKEQTYGDALEATIASALRRCGKRLGIGIEMWDRSFTNAWLLSHTVKVQVNVARRGEPEEIKYWYRRKIDPPFWNEKATTRTTPAAAPRATAPTPPTAPVRTSAPAPAAVEGVVVPERIGATARETEAALATATRRAAAVIPANAISPEQRTRLWTIARNCGRTETEIKMWLLARYGLDSTSAIPRASYDEIVNALEKPGTLPLPDDPPREPGEEG